MATKINILIVDDHNLVRTGLVRTLGDIKSFHIVGEADSGEQAMTRVAALVNTAQAPDVILMDMRMAGIGGMEATRQITEKYPFIKVLAVTSCSETPFPQRFIESGAAGFVTKDSAIDEVMLAIQTIYRGKRYISQRVAQQMAMNPMASEAEGSPFSLLSDRELQIALMVIDGIKTAEIGESLSVSPKTVNTYRYRLFEKLNIKNNMELAMLASRHGLLETDDA